MNRVLLFLGGYKLFRVGREDATELMNICQRYGYVYRDSYFDEDHIFFKTSLPVAKRIQKKCAERGIELTLVREYGLPALLLKYRHRYGIAAGLLIFVGIVFFSGRVIWDIRVSGNDKLSEAEVISELKACGFSVGDVRSRVDASALENRVVIYSDDIAWISVNIVGTVAEVEIREAEVAEEEIEYAASNIVAARDGEIERFEDTRGNILLNIGDRVREGELIISGLYDSATKGIRYTNAKGKVFARTEREMNIEIPLEYDKKVYTGRVFTEKYLVFFEKEIKFCGNSGNSYPSCDTIDTVEYLNFFSGGELPVGIRTVKYVEYEYELTQRTPEEAMELGFYKLACESAALAKSVELTRKDTRTEIQNSAYVIKCKIECIENIAISQKIEINGLP